MQENGRPTDRGIFIQEVMMKCDGVWKVEIAAAYGMERIATAFMKNGKYLAASTGHYSVGTYTLHGDDVVISADVKQYADLRTVFGLKTTRKMHVIIKCKIKKDVMKGKSRLNGKKKHEVVVQLTRLDTLE
jgi:hypothetical protein